MNIDWVIQVPFFVRWLFPGSLWRGDKNRKVVYLTFDDGPVPEQTHWVLDLLKSNDVKATFFCVGENVHKHPELFDRLVSEGHVVGNHTYNHLPYFKKGVSWAKYKENISLCDTAECGKSRFFRAPHGHVTPFVTWTLTHCSRDERPPFEKVVFWDVMPKDYDNRLSPEQVFDNVRKFVRPGSIIVFHDSIKAGDRMRFALEKTITWLKSEGWAFEPLG